jgi:hypothetical protein
MPSYLIVANQTLASPTLADAVAKRIASGGASFHVVVPATPVSHGLTWDEAEAEAAAQERLDQVLERLRRLGAEATGEVGARDPVAAVEDAMRTRVVEEVILSTLPPGISRWLGQDVPSRLRHAVDVPVTVVIAPDAPGAPDASAGPAPPHAPPDPPAPDVPAA